MLRIENLRPLVAQQASFHTLVCTKRAESQPEGRDANNFTAAGMGLRDDISCCARTELAVRTDSSGCLH